MNAEAELMLSVALLVMARVSAFLAVVPFYAFARVPPIARAVLAIAIALSLVPVLFDDVAPSARNLGSEAWIGLLAGELVIGLALGFLVRLFFLAIQFAASVAAQVVGFTGLMGPGVADDELTTPLADLIVLFSTLLFFINDLHLLAVERMVQSYAALPPGRALDPFAAIEAVSATASAAFAAALQLSAPFIVYGTVCNVLLGLANRLVPQVPIQFVAAPAILTGGLMVALLVLSIASAGLTMRFGGWISQGLEWPHDPDRH
ncbi:MAG: flagellar biosynthetic protein FliR [Hyphomicrobium sp.]|nr:flagellar biosynthetic protein FliR [Hyphomicrobium sp.]